MKKRTEQEKKLSALRKTISGFRISKRKARMAHLRASMPPPETIRKAMQSGRKASKADEANDMMYAEANEEGVYEGSHPGCDKGQGVEVEDLTALLTGLVVEFMHQYPDVEYEVENGGKKTGEKVTLPVELSYKDINDVKRRIISAIDEMIES